MVNFLYNMNIFAYFIVAEWKIIVGISTFLIILVLQKVYIALYMHLCTCICLYECMNEWMYHFLPRLCLYCIWRMKSSHNRWKFWSYRSLHSYTLYKTICFIMPYRIWMQQLFKSAIRFGWSDKYMFVSWCVWSPIRSFFFC